MEELGAAEAARQAADPGEDLPVYDFAPRPEPQPVWVESPRAEGPVEELIPLLYGNITKGTSTLGSAGVRVPGSAGETSEVLEQTRGIPSLIMADGPAGLRLRQSYQTDRATGRVYGVGVLGSLENGFWRRRSSTRTPTHGTSSVQHSQWALLWPRAGTPA